MRLDQPRSFVLLALVPLAGCLTGTYSQRDPHTIATTRVDEAVEGRSTLGMPIPLPGQPTCLVPFARETEKWPLWDRDPFTYGGYTASSVESSVSSTSYWMRAGEVRWHNAVIRSVAQGGEWMLLDRRGVISHWWALVEQPTPTSQPKCRCNIFAVTLDDTNHDGRLDDRDARVALYTSGDGSAPRVVTAANMQLSEVAFDSRQGVAFLYLIEDTNGDGVFTTDDQPMPYVVSVDTGSEARRVVSDAALERAQALLDAPVKP